MRTTTAFGRHAAGALLEALVLATLVGALLLSLAPHLAGAGTGTANAARYWMEVGNGVYGQTTLAHVYGDRSDYWVKASCFQAGELVYQQWAKADVTGRATLTLGPTERWTGGSADCTADGGYYGKNFRWHRAATATFSAAGN